MKANLNKILFVGIGIVIGVLLTLILLPKKVSKLSDGSEEVVSVGNLKISANQYYNKLKEQDQLGVLLRHINITLIKEKYPDKEEEAQKFGEENYEKFKQQFTLYNIEESDALAQYGYRSKEDFIQYMSEDYYLNKYYEDTLASRFSEDELRSIYSSSYFATKHVYIFSSTDSKNDLTKIKKALKTKSIDSVIKSYSSVAYNEFDIQFTDTLYGEDILNAVKSLKAKETSEVGSNSTFGNYLIYVESVYDEEAFEEVKDIIVKSKISDLEAEDENLSYKVMFDLQKENNIDFKDQVLKEKYEELLKDYYK